MQQDNVILANPTIESLIEPYAIFSPKQSDFEGYKNHCLRMLNVILALSEEEPDRLEKLEIALAFHGITVFPDRTLDYLESSSEIARKYLLAIGREEWIKEITLMIGNHHKITKYTGEYANLVEAFRQSDWIDVSFARLRFGLSKAWVKVLHRQLILSPCIRKRCCQ